MSNNLYAIILAGGSGSRLWPLSREMYPKQLLKINDDNTLFQSTFMKLVNVIDDKNIISVTNVKHEPNLRIQLEELQNKFCRESKYKIITEPLGRNTAPAIAVAAKYVQDEYCIGEEPIVIITPSDHLIMDEASYSEALQNAIRLAKAGYIAVFGVKPTSPDTGFGYIKTKNDKTIHEIAEEACKVEEFKEKPDKKTAQKYVKSGNYYWNAGIFVAKASVILSEIEKYSPEIHGILAQTTISNAIPSIEYNQFEKMPDISFDYAVMEKSKKVALIPLECGWNDLGSWEAIHNCSPKDESDNYIIGNAKAIDCKNSMIYSTSKLTTAVGISDTIIVETEDALLVCNKAKSQDVKKIYEELKNENNETFFIHKTVYRPWGYYTVMQQGEGFMTKCIVVNPDARLSLQRHKHRSEHWVVLEGKAKIIKNENEHTLSPGESIDIGVMEVHSLQNPYKKPLKILEVQKGDILDENDIERLEDIYGRV